VREQGQAVKALEDWGWEVRYGNGPNRSILESLRRSLGEKKPYDAMAAEARNRETTNEDLELLVSLPHLTSVEFDGTRVTDDGLAYVGKLKRLTYLSLERTRVTDVGLPYLKGLTDLTLLNLSETRVTDEGLASLEGLTQLEQLFLDDTQVTAAGVKNLQKALPDCIIIHSFEANDADTR
jgi:hypothetical protein